jgi:hypothetical protein
MPSGFSPLPERREAARFEGAARAQAAKPPSTDAGGQTSRLFSLNPYLLAFINALLVSRVRERAKNLNREKRREGVDFGSESPSLLLSL